MDTSPQKETLAALRLRHSQLVSKPSFSVTPEISRLNLLSKLASIQIDLLRLYTSNAQAKLLHDQLDALSKEPISTDDLRVCLLALLHP